MADIRHFVVLMLENRSFDSLLGTLTGIPGLDGLPPNACNKIGGISYPAGGPVVTPSATTVPDPDPGEKFVDINQQIFGDENGRKPGAVATMGGFAANYQDQKVKTQGPGFSNPNDPMGTLAAYAPDQVAPPPIYDPAAVMHAYTEAQVPVLHALARSFGVCDRWFASAPCQTWPNRFFAHAATCHGIVNNDRFLLGGEVPFTGPSVFGSLEAKQIPWRVYFHDFPQSILLKDVLELAPKHYGRFENFLVDAHQNALPSYAFIEPRYFSNIATGDAPNDQHPPHDIRFAEQLIYDVYTALRASDQWQNTLLLITYDEHGGCYDHVPPPPAIPPDGHADPDSGFAFDTYGVRVPAVVVSPWIPAGSLLRSGAYPFDHTSISKTLQELYGIAPLTERDKRAPSLLPFLSLQRATNGGPANLPNPNAVADRNLLQRIGALIANGFQTALGDALDFLSTNNTNPDAAGSSAADVAAKGSVDLAKLLS